MKNLALHWKIIIGLVLGLIYGIFSASYGLGTFTTNWIAPFGTVFINLLKLIAVPLVFASLVGYYVFNEIPDLFTWLGASIIFLGVFIMSYREMKLDKEIIRKR